MVKSDKTKFMEILLQITCCSYNTPLIQDKTDKLTKELKELFLKHYNISEDEILALAKAIKLKRKKEFKI